MTEMDAVAASGLASAAILAALVQALIEKSTLSSDEARQIYEAALLMIEERQADVGDAAEVFAMARAVIEEHLLVEGALSI